MAPVVAVVHPTPYPRLQHSTNPSSPRNPSLVPQLQGSRPLLSSIVCSLILLRKQRSQTGRPLLPCGQILFGPCQISSWLPMGGFT